VLVSKEINWISTGISDPNNVDSMYIQMNKVLKNKEKYIRKNLISLKNYNKKSTNTWIDFLYDNFEC